MLARADRLRQSQDFRNTMRSGRRAARPSLVAHVAPSMGERTIAGFVVSKAVGPSVVRNRVKRRLRHLIAPHLESLPRGTRVVVRALPPAAEASSDQLRTDLGKALAKAGVL